MLTLALAAGFALDLALGDPPRMPHLVVAIGKAVAGLETMIRHALPRTPRGEIAGGAILVFIVASLSYCAPFLLVTLASRLHPWAGRLAEIFICCQVLATKSLRDAAMRVYDALAAGDLGAARRAVAMIVGRDTDALDAAGVTRATVETVAENASDGVVAPMLYFALGGAPLAVLYKAINTMDSMLGYKNDKYLYFGRTAARLDDAANRIPARLTALLLIAAACRRFDWRNALRIYRRDRNAHGSPNAGHPEAACAGALGIRLGGDSAYDGRVVRKPTLGDPLREIEPADIQRACKLLYGAAALCLLLCCGVILLGEAAPWN